MKDGDKIFYIKEDSGQVLDSGLWLTPGEELIVGVHVSTALAERLVEDNVCRLAAGDQTIPAQTIPAQTIPAQTIPTIGNASLAGLPLAAPAPVAAVVNAQKDGD